MTCFIFLLRMYQMLYSSRLPTLRDFYHIDMDCRSTAPTQSLIRHYAIFGQTGPPQWVDCLAPLRKYRREVSFPRDNSTLPSSGTELRAHNFAITYLRSYLLSCTAASWDDIVKCFTQEHKSACVIPCLGIELTTLQLLSKYAIFFS